MKNFLYIVFLLFSCSLNPEIHNSPVEEYIPSMGIVNFVDLADLSFTVLAGISPNVGTLSNVRDKNNSTSYGYVLDCGYSRILVCMSCGASYRYVFTFNKPYFITSIVINQLLNCNTSSSINSTFYK